MADTLDGVLQTEVEIAFGKSREDKDWRTIKGVFGQLIDEDDQNAPLAHFNEGEKDGPCILQGALIVGQRIAKNVTRNYLMMFDHDTGESLDEIEGKIRAAGLFALLWTTYNHMTSETMIPEDQLLKWAKVNGIKPDAITAQQAADFLKETKKVKPEIFVLDAFDGFLTLERVHVEGGMKFRLHHKPMPRVRSLFLLERPFDFANRGASQAAAILEWKERYAGLATQLGLTWDRSCVDPSRLMYLPRFAPGTDYDALGHEIRPIPGKLLDIDAVPRVEAERKAGSRRWGAAGSTDALRPLLQGNREEAAAIEEEADERRFKTPGLMRFLKRHAGDFEAADWLSSVAPEDIRHDHGDKVDFRCPNEDGHSEQKADDRAFMAVNASMSDHGFHMGCLHNTCIEASGKDRAWYLDQACQYYGISHASELEEYCTSVSEEEIKTEEHADALAAAIEKLGPNSSATDIDLVLTELAKRGESTTTRALLNDVVKKIEWRRADIEKAFNAAKKKVKEEARAQDDGEGGDPRNPPSDPAKATIIWEHWPHTEKKRCAAGRFCAENDKDPIVFRRKADNSIVRLNGDDRLTVDPMDKDKWAEELEEHMQFMRASPDGGLDQDIPAFPGCVRTMHSGREHALPVLDRIVQIPVFGPDGSLRWDKGYHPGLHHYINPNLDVRPVPDVITEADVDEAVAWISEAIIDFPFSDTFDGADTLPQYTDERDADGWHVPNYDRGRCSRANFIAMMLQPIVRGMIDGPCPAYHIDKSAPGTGAGYLANVVSVILEGQAQPPQPMSDNDEELRKVITAALIDGAHIIFLDNINRRVASGHLAAALTAGVWKDRILGSSEIATVPNSATWILAGNNLQFSHELMRRNVPIRIDANVPNPTQDRPASAFKHELTPWLKANRANLLWSLHVIGCWWLQNGAHNGSKRIHSFDSWSNVMSGILEAAGIDGFLDNIENYLGNKDDEIGSYDAFAKHLYSVFGTEPMKVSEMLAKSCNALTGNFSFDLPVIGHNEHAQTTNLGKLVRQGMSGQTFRLHDDGLLGKLVKIRQRNPAVYKWVLQEST